MIDHQLLDKKYPSDKEEDKEIENQLKQIKENYGSTEELYQSMLKQYFGVETEKELEQMLRLEYKRTKAVEDFIEDNLKDDEIEKYYNENITGDIKASHILIKPEVKEDATEEEKEKAEKKAKEEAEKVIKELEKGKDFKELAKKYSDDEATKENGGDLGYFSTDEMVEEFANAVKDLKEKEYTKEPIETEFGYHIILKVDQKEKKKLKEVKDSIKEKLREQKLENDATLHYQTLMDIREKNNIKWNDDALKKEYENYMKSLMDNAKENASSN